MRRSPPALLLCFAVFGVSLTRSSSATATTPSPAEQQAEAAFQRARALMAENRHAEACPLLDASYRLASGLGTLINLGGCYEHTGKLALAHRTYQKAEAQAHSSGRDEREHEAASLRLSLEPRVGRLRITIASKKPSSGSTATTTTTTTTTTGDDGVIVNIDNEELDHGIHRAPIAVEPGKHHLRIKTTTSTFDRDVDVSAGANVEVRVEENANPNNANANGADTGPAKTPTNDRARGYRIGAYVAFGVGVVATGVATGFLLRASSKYSESDAHCTDRGCDPTGLDLVSSARSSGNVATALFVVGGAGLAAGAAFLILTPSSSTSGRIPAGSHATVSVSGSSVVFRTVF